MQVLKGGAILFITLSFFLITSSMAVIRDPIHRRHLVGVERNDQFSIGVKRKIPTGPNPLHNARAPRPSPAPQPSSPPQPSPPLLLKHSHLIGVERKVSNGFGLKHKTSCVV
ncbi:unnamed protein product [Microthlaspi erraticum]|uniref:Uncharacterized protein n=1 Tax=Microthlaspi erraticum TaxID=1685480 RepID=A0A6D2J722_9BRAS|nr:unnamed protein product [Microthlaspi erraticum]